MTPRTRRTLTAATIGGLTALGVGLGVQHAYGQQTPASATVGNAYHAGKNVNVRMAVRVFRPAGIRSITVTVQIRAAERPGGFGRAWATRTFQHPASRRDGRGTVTRRCAPGPRVLYLYGIVRVKVVNRQGRVVMNRLTGKSPGSIRTTCAR